MTIQNPNNIGRAIVRVKSIRLPAEIVIKREEVEVEVGVDKIIYEDSPETLERLAKAEAALAVLEQVKETFDERPESPSDDQRDPPEELADLFDPTLTPRENHDKLISKYARLMSEREHALKGSDDSEAMRLLKKAETVESGIKWNRAVHAELLG